VSEAVDGVDGLKVIARQRPALILLDLMMPRMNGFEFVVELRKHPEWRVIPVIIVTAKILTSEERLRLSGYVEKILKKEAFSRDALLVEVGEWVGRCIRQRDGETE
jgi:CheY-like chemotaxis protein